MSPSSLFAAASGSALLLLACGGKVVVDAQGAGGQGGTGTSSSTTTTTTSTNAVTSTVTSGAPCTNQSCGEALGSGTSGQLCNPSSEKAYSLLIACVCASKCQTSCAANICISAPLTPPCKACVGDPQNGCGNELNDCGSN